MDPGDFDDGFSAACASARPSSSPAPVVVALRAPSRGPASAAAVS